ncbi:MAG: ribonuclease [Gallionella sp.]|nr:ribonuclease [Gallionella sp.]
MRIFRSSSTGSAFSGWAFLLALLLALLLWLPQVQAGQAELALIAMAELPAEARVTLQAIKRGGPFVYERDGAVFRSYERILPKQPRGYYREYTVRTPGARNRGARRIVCGPPVECYYTADHYQTFKRIREQP